MVRYIAMVELAAAHMEQPQAARDLSGRAIATFAAQSRGALVIVRSRSDLAQFLTTRNSVRRSPVFWARRARSLLKASWKILTSFTSLASA